MNRKQVEPSAIGGVAYPMMYPEIFYRLQPDITLACDELDKYGSKNFSQEIIEQMTDRVHDNVCKRYPDLAGYAHEYEKNYPISPNETSNMFGMQIRRRGIFRDLIAFLLLAELLRRRRRRRF